MPENFNSRYSIDSFFINMSNISESSTSCASNALLLSTSHSPIKKVRKYHIKNIDCEVGITEEPKGPLELLPAHEKKPDALLVEKTMSQHSLVTDGTSLVITVEGIGSVRASALLGV